MPMYNLLEYSDNYLRTSGSVSNYHRDELSDDANENAADNNSENKKITTSRSVDYKTKIIRGTPDDINTLDPELVVPLKCVSNFWRSLDLPLINCEIELDLS